MPGAKPKSKTRTRGATKEGDDKDPDKEVPATVPGKKDTPKDSPDPDDVDDDDDDDDDEFYDPPQGDDMTHESSTYAPVFAPLPSMVTTSILEYGTRSANSLYEGAVRPLETRYDLSSEHLLKFLLEIEHRARAYFWSPNFNVITATGL